MHKIKTKAKNVSSTYSTYFSLSLSTNIMSGAVALFDRRKKKLSLLRQTFLVRS
jgi:hypothetical protein